MTLLRQGRTWAAAGYVVLATLLASRDHRPGWTLFVALSTTALAVAALAYRHAADQPERARRRAERDAERFQAEVDAIVARHDLAMSQTRREARRSRRRGRR